MVTPAEPVPGAGGTHAHGHHEGHASIAQRGGYGEPCIEPLKQCRIR